MSQFKQQYIAARLGTLSQESAETSSIADYVEPSAITSEDVLEVQAEREQLKDVTETVVEIGEDVQFLKESSSATAVVALAADMAPKVSPIDSDNFVALANESFKSSGLILGSTIPSLEVAIDGSITDLSQEALGDWFKEALPAFAEAGKRFFARIQLSFRQINTSNKALAARLVRVKTKMGSRRGAGGKHIKLSQGIRFQLIKGDVYSSSLPTDLKAHWDLTEKAVEILLEYETRLSDHIKKRITDAISGGRTTDFVGGFSTDDLVKRFESLVAEQTMLLGNRRIGMVNDHRTSKALAYTVVNVTPDAKVLAKNLDLPISLTNDEIGTLAPIVQDLIADQLISLENTMNRVDNGITALWQTLDRLNTSWVNDQSGRPQYRPLGGGVDAAELLRLENELLEELAEVSERLTTFQMIATNQVDAVLTLMEESIFQD